MTDVVANEDLGVVSVSRQCIPIDDAIQRAVSILNLGILPGCYGRDERSRTQWEKDVKEKYSPALTHFNIVGRSDVQGVMNMYIQRSRIGILFDLTGFTERTPVISEFSLQKKIFLIGHIGQIV